MNANRNNLSLFIIPYRKRPRFTAKKMKYFHQNALCKILMQLIHVYPMLPHGNINKKNKKISPLKFFNESETTGAATQKFKL